MRIKGSKISEETRLKMSLAKLGKPSGRKGLPSPNKGKPMSEEQKKKISEAKKGKRMSDESIAKMAATKRGKPSGKRGKKYSPLSEEHKQKLKEASLKNGNKPPSTKGLKHSAESIAKRVVKFRGQKRPSITGENNWRWRGGISRESDKIRATPEYAEWRRSVFRRDNFTCVLCEARSCKGSPVVLHADHIKRFSEYPELRFDINNGRTLCESCHKKTDNYGSKGITRERNKSGQFSSSTVNDLKTITSVQ